MQMAPRILAKAGFNSLLLFPFSNGESSQSGEERAKEREDPDSIKRKSSVQYSQVAENEKKNHTAPKDRVKIRWSRARRFLPKWACTLFFSHIVSQHREAEKLYLQLQSQNQRLRRTEEIVASMNQRMKSYQECPRSLFARWFLHFWGKWCPSSV